jgi:hypothetical protein
MPEILVRSGVLILVCLVIWFTAWSGRRFVETQRHRALAATLPATLSGNNSGAIFSSQWPVRILSFSSADCRQCHQLQVPVLQRVVEICGDKVAVLEVDAPSEPELTDRYHVLTVPTTVVLDATGRAHAVNYGFANAQKLLEQVDAVLAEAVS